MTGDKFSIGMPVITPHGAGRVAAAEVEAGVYLVRYEEGFISQRWYLWHDLAPDHGAIREEKINAIMQQP